jgi:hypothetical protein
MDTNSRRPFQFGLKWLFVLTAGVALFLFAGRLGLKGPVSMTLAYMALYAAIECTLWAVRSAGRRL